MNHALYENVHRIPGSIPAAPVVSLTVSSDQPYLKDHDVGMPLFGTVLSLEAMAESRSCIYPDNVTQIRDVAAGEDCLFPPGSFLRARAALACKCRDALSAQVVFPDERADRQVP